MAERFGLVPNYGRDYKSKKAVLADWDANLDFKISDFGPNDGRATNKSDLASYAPGATVTVRYDRSLKVMVIKT